MTSASKLMADFNLVSKYSNKNWDGSRETFEQAVDRMFDMHTRKHGDKIRHAGKWTEFVNVRENVKKKKLLGSQRSLQFAGPAIEKRNMRQYNCAYSFCDRPRFFAEAMWLLLAGVGCGFSVQSHHITKLPPVKPLGASTTPFLIEDSIEGWADSFDALVNYWFGLRETKPIFDFSAIRAKDQPISSGGLAPGPKPLKLALERIEQVFQKCSDNGFLRPIDAYDIVMHASDSVMSGGVRRAALICLFSPTDTEMMTAKSGNWFEHNPQRGRSNNSAVLKRGDNNLDSFIRLMRSAREFGEPGFVFVESLEYGMNPCSEIQMCPLLIKHNDLIVQEYTLDLLEPTKRSQWEAQGYTFDSGWQLCNLCELNATAWKSREEALENARDGAILGTVQASYTDTTYLGETSRHIVEREALLGVSMTGMMDNPSLAFDPELLQSMAKTVVDTNKEWASILGINQAARTTCVKPAGNSSIILSDEFYVASGIHAHHARRFFRLVQVSKNDPVLEIFQRQNPHLIEESVWSANKNDVVIYFPIETKPGAIVKDDLTAIEFLEKVKLAQQNWVVPGTAKPMSCEGATHNVSNTCVVKSSEWGAVGRFIYGNQKWFTGISLLGASGDFVYRQAPMQRIYFQDELVGKFGSMNVGAAKHLKRHIAERFGDLFEVMIPLRMVLLGYHTEDAVKGTKIHPELLWDSYKKLRSLIHLENVDDVLLLLSAIDHEEKWLHLTSKMQSVDYSSLTDYVSDAMDVIACGGGQCEIDFKPVKT